MENFVSVLAALLLIGALVRLMAAPAGLAVKLALNSACGFLCLWLLNWISGFTGILFPVNPVTAAVAGFLGLPGIALLALSQVILI